MAGFQKIDGDRDIQGLTIKDAEIATDAAIAESKLALQFTTGSIVSSAVMTDSPRTIQEGVYVTFPASGFKMIDIVNGKTYLFLLQNGVLTAQEV